MGGFGIELELCRRSDAGAPFTLRASFETADGITVVAGASGAGKSTLLLAVLGAVRPDSGRIRVADRVLFDSARSLSVPIRRRAVGMVFQDALLFPHLTVARNVAFGARGQDRERASDELLEQVGARDLARRRVHELSGGERQRVALARALASRPSALLLDEPFSALDAASRESLGRLLVELQAETGIPFMHVTHDLAEALRLGDHLVLLDAGRVVQTGPPARVITRPESIVAARAVGTENLLAATVVRHDPDRGCSEVEFDGTTVQTVLLQDPPGSRVALGLRAEDVLLSLRPLSETSARNVLPGTIASVESRGAAVMLGVETPAPLRVIVTPASRRELGLEPGKQVYLLIKAVAFHRLV